MASEITLLSWITHTRNHFLQSKVCALPLSTQDTPLVFLKTIIEFIFTLCFKRKKGIRLITLDVGFDAAAYYLISTRTPIRHGMQRQSCWEQKSPSTEGFNNETHRRMYAWSNEFTDSIILFFFPLEQTSHNWERGLQTFFKETYFPLPGKCECSPLLPQIMLWSFPYSEKSQRSADPSAMDKPCPGKMPFHNHDISAAKQVSMKLPIEDDINSTSSRE